jgi:hypothetical protein
VKVGRRILEILLLGCALSMVPGGADTLNALEDSEQLVSLVANRRENMIAKSDQPSSPTQPSKGAPGGNAGTFIAKLEHAPYPYAGKYGDSDLDFFDYISPESGERFHTNRYGIRLAEKAHYQDNSVLFHVPRHLDPRKPLVLVVYFHEIQSDIRKSSRDYALTKQIENSRCNAILVMPQLAKDVADSSPGKFFQRSAFKAFMDEVAEVLTMRLGAAHASRLAEAPLLIAAFSGGYKSAAYVLDRGGVDDRILGVVLMDALYEDVDKFQHWILANSNRAFFMNIYGKGECEANSKMLAAELNRPDLMERPSWPDRIAKGKIYFIRTREEHLMIPLLGPPHQPLRTVLHSIGDDPLLLGGIRRDSQGR